MEKTPEFIKKFSKEESSEERRQAAEEIKAKRTEYFAEKHAQEEKQKELQQTTSEREQALEEKLEAIHNLRDEIAEISTSRLRKILNYFELRKLRADAVIGQQTYDVLKKTQKREIAERETISEGLNSEETPPDLQEAREILDNFYKEQKEKWAESEYTREDIVKNFSGEHLSSLSLEDYAILLRRFPGEMVTHVTRQGVRDHTGDFHTGDKGLYLDHFMRMTEDGRLRSPLGVYLAEKEKEQAVARFFEKYLGLDLNDFETKEEALDRLAELGDFIDREPQERKAFLTAGALPTYADKMAIHFGLEEVVDRFYGAERGNEIFIAYPSAYIASQYYFHGRLSGDKFSLERTIGDKWNDQWVWANEERGIDLNAGIVFIPKEAKVERKTGSRYELDEDGTPIKNSEYIDAFLRVANSPDCYEFVSQARKIEREVNIDFDSSKNNLGREFNSDWNNKDKPWRKKKYKESLKKLDNQRNQELSKKLDPFYQKLEKEFNITDRRLQRVILDRDLVNWFKGEVRGVRRDESKILEKIERAFEKEGILYVEAKDTIRSKEFWETYFSKNPIKKPKKIVYYEGSDPTKALYNWRDRQGIFKRLEEKDMGFPERHIEPDKPQATAGIDRFRSLIEKVVENHFDQRKAAA